MQTTLGAYSVNVGPEIEDSVGRLMDQDRDGIVGEPLDDRFNVVFNQVPVPQVWIIDDGGAGFSAEGGWSTYTGVGLQGDFSYKQAGSGAATASWTFTDLAPGQYRVSVTWQAYSNRVVDAAYAVLDGASELATVLVNQQQPPAGFSEEGVPWQDLGAAYEILSGTLVVRLSDLADPPGSYLVADGVRVERVGDLPSGPEIQVLAGGVDVADGTGLVDFGGTEVGVPVARTITVRNGGTAELSLGAITVPAGFSLAADFGETALAPGQTTSFVVQLDAAAEGDYSGTVSFESNDGDENPFDFTVSGTVSVEVVPQVWFEDDGGAGFSAEGGWSTYNGVGLQGDFSYKQAGSGAATASWTFTDLTPGQYRVSVTWQAYSNRVVDAAYAVLDGASELETVLINQQQPPAGFSEEGVPWQDLGAAYEILSGTLVVRLSDLADPPGNYLVADGVRVERVGDLPSGPEIQVLAGGVDVADGTGLVDFGGTEVGVPVARTITVRNGGTAELSLGAITVPAGFSLAAGFGETALAPGQTTSFVVQLDAAAEGDYSGTVSFESNDGDENPFDFTVSGTVSVEAVQQVWFEDDGGAGFSAEGGWSTYNGVGLQGDFLYKQAGSGAATASWTFTDLTPGQYRVSVTWQAYSNRVVDAAYAVLDGASELATVLINQQQPPAGFSEEGVPWQDLGAAYKILSGTLVVRLSDLADPPGNYLVADGVRVERVGDLPSGPEIQVLAGGVDVADGTGLVDFGGTEVGVPVARTITVRNGGTAELSLGAITVPAGFSLAADFGETALAPGQTTSFVVQLDAAAEGDYSGTVSFESNDGDENPFDFTVSGTVSVEAVQQVWFEDDGGAGFSAEGGWSTYNGVGLQGDFLYKQAGSGAATASWTFTDLTPGQYRVSVTWQAYSNRVVDAAYAVLDGTSELETVLINQQQPPAGFSEEGVPWQDLGAAYEILSGTLVVRLSDLADPPGNYLVADGVRVERVGDLPSGPEIQVLAGGVDVADGTGLVDFGGTEVGVPVARTITVRNGGTAELSLGAITVPAGFSLAADFGETALAPGQTTSFVVQLDAAAEGDYSGTVSFESNDGDENPFDFTVSGTVSVEAVQQVWFEDDGGAGFSAEGGWSTYNGVGLQGDFSYKQAGSGAATASWTFTDLTPGQYLVSVTWQAYSNRVVDAAYAVLDGTSELATVLINQQQPPAGFSEEGVPWQDLGAAYEILSGTLVVRLSDLADPPGNYLVADGVRVERVGDLPSGPEIQVLAGGVDVADGTGLVDFGGTEVGVPVARTITVRNGGTAELSLGSITVPAGFSLAADFGETALASGQTTSFVVQLDAAAEGDYSGTVSFESNDGDESPFDFTVSGTVSVEAVPQVRTLRHTPSFLLLVVIQQPPSSMVTC